MYILHITYKYQLVSYKRHLERHEEAMPRCLFVFVFYFGFKEQGISKVLWGERKWYRKFGEGEEKRKEKMCLLCLALR